MSRTLGEVATIVRSKNAGPFWVTVDVFAGSDADYRDVCDSPLTDAACIAAVYGVDEGSVEVHRVDALRAVKISFPRPLPQGSLGDTDQHAGQQYVALLDLPVGS